MCSPSQVKSPSITIYPFPPYSPLPPPSPSPLVITILVSVSTESFYLKKSLPAWPPTHLEISE